MARRVARAMLPMVALALRGICGTVLCWGRTAPTGSLSLSAKAVRLQQQWAAGWSEGLGRRCGGVRVLRSVAHRPTRGQGRRGNEKK
jgi:hypothetical protein